MICIMLLGSTFCIWSKFYLSGTLISIFPGVFFLSRLFFNKKISCINFLLLFCLFLILVCSAISLFFYRTSVNFEYFKAFILIFFSFVIVISIPFGDRHIAENGVMFFFAIIMLYAFLQISYIFFHVGMNPVRPDLLSKAYIVENAFQYSGVRSIYSDTNNFSFVCVLLTIYFLYATYFSRTTKLFLSIVLFFMVIFSASRSCFVADSIILGLFFLKEIKDCAAFCLFSLLIFFSVSFLSGYSCNSFSNSFFISKLLTIFSIVGNFLNGQALNDSSITSRGQNYLLLFQKFDQLGFGSFNAQHYDLAKNSLLFSQNPHSLIVEFSFLYGYLGLMVSLFLFLWFYLSIRKVFKKSKSVVITASLFLLTFVCSSTISFPAFWFLFFLSAVFSCNEMQSSAGNFRN